MVEDSLIDRSSSDEKFRVGKFVIANTLQPSSDMRNDIGRGLLMFMAGFAAPFAGVRICRDG